MHTAVQIEQHSSKPNLPQCIELRAKAVGKAVGGIPRTQTFAPGIIILYFYSLVQHIYPLIGCPFAGHILYKTFFSLSKRDRIRDTTVLFVFVG
jgi:hypothetical protein